ncbi:MAG TPA: efflux RND transporter periplasmic adaptor subunit [Chryseolinea sp.]
MKTKITIASLTVVLFVSVAFKLKNNKRAVEENVYRPDANKKVLVQADTAVVKSLHKTFTYTGTFAAFREVMLVPQVHGEVEAVYFDEGDHVVTGSRLVQIDDDLLQAQYSSAAATYQNAKRNLERYEGASQSGGVSNLQLDNLRLTLINAQAQVKQLAKQIEWSNIIAPFTGTMTLRDVEPGSVVGSGAVARITDLSQLKLEISVPEKEIFLFHEGDSIAIETDLYPGKTLWGKTDQVADRGDNAHNYSVRLLLKNTDPASLLKAGMYGTALLNKGMKDQTLVIARTSLLGSAKDPHVFVIHEGKASLRSIRTGNANDTSIEVVEGLHAGDIVVASGHINLSNGSPVDIVK